MNNPPTYILEDLLDYMQRLKSRFERSGKASSEDLTMQQYMIDIIEGRIQNRGPIDVCENNKK